MVPSPSDSVHSGVSAVVAKVLGRQAVEVAALDEGQWEGSLALIVAVKSVPVFML